MIESFEQSSLEIPKINILEKKSLLNSGFDSNITSTNGAFQRLHSDCAFNTARWIGIDPSKMNELPMSDVFDATKRMYFGFEIGDSLTLGLRNINKMRINPKFYEANLNQHAGFAAEVISTYKENLVSKIYDTGIKTYRADDRAFFEQDLKNIFTNSDDFDVVRDKLKDIADKNDQYVDKIRVNVIDKNIERVQTKFVGKDGADCLSKLKSKTYDKYFTDGKVDKIEIPKEHYEQIKKEGLIEKQRESLKKQLDKVKELGKQEEVIKKEKQLERLDQIEKMVEPSNITKAEARYAVEHPKRYVAKNFAKEIMNKSEVKAGFTAAALTMSISTVEDIQQVMEGKMTAKEAFTDVAKDTGTAGAFGAGTEFISKSVATAMSKSSHELINKCSNLGIPAAIVSFGIDSYDSVVDFAQGEIDGEELAYDLGESGARVAGGMAGTMAATAAGAKIGAVVGSVVPGAGTAAGAVVGALAGAGVSIVGGMVGTAIASEAYKTAVELGSDGVDVLANKAQEVASNTIEKAKTAIPDKVEDLKSVINNFAKSNSIPIHV